MPHQPRKPHQQNRPLKPQHCPLCQNEVKPQIRYPNYICQNCLSDGVEVNGKSLSLAELDVYHHPSVACRVNGVDCIAIEARFGGVVVSPC